MTAAFTPSVIFANLAAGNQPLSNFDTVFNQLTSLLANPSTFSNYAADTGAANTYAVAPAQAWTAYAAGQMLIFKAANSNTGASTINVSSLGAKNITRQDLTSLQNKDILANGLYLLGYDGTQFQLLGNLYTGGTLSNAMNFAPSVSLASAATVNIGAAASNNVIITGTTTITAFDTIAEGAIRFVKFSGALTLTYNATSMILPGTANITTAANDCAIFESLGGGNWICQHYQRASGLAITSPTSAWTQLASVTPTAAATVDFLTTFSATYDNYLILFEGIKPSAADDLLVRLANAGSADTGSNYIQVTLNNTTATTTSTSIDMMGGNNSGTGNTASGYLWVMNANDATNLKVVMLQTNWRTSTASNNANNTTTYMYTPANAVSGIRFYWSGGNNFAAQGRIRIFGAQN